MLTNRIDSKVWFSLAFLGLIAIAIVAWRFCCTVWVDDWCYKLMPHGHEEFWNMEGEEITSFAQAVEAVVKHHQYCTPRLPNYIQVFFNLVPPWAFQPFIGLMLVSSFVMILVTAGGRRLFQSPVMVVAGCLASWIVLPINNAMVSSDFALNYFLPTPVVLLFVYFFVKDRFVSSHWRWFPLVVAVVAGTMHEGFTLPISAGCLTLIAIERRDRCRRLILWGLMTSIALLFFFAPGTFERIDGYIMSHDTEMIKWQIINIMLECYGLYLLVAALLMAVIKRSFNRFVRDNLLWIVAMACCLVIAFATLMRGRVLWYVDVVGLILFIKVLWLHYSWWCRPHYAVSALLAAFMLFSILTAAVVQHQQSADSDEVARQARVAETPVVFHDYRDPATCPWWTFGVPQSVTESYANSIMAKYFYHEPNMIILPEKFRDCPVEEWDKAPGNTGLSGRFPFYVGRTSVSGDCFFVTMGEQNVYGNPLYAVVNGVRQAGATIYPVSSWNVVYQGDTLYCYMIDYMRRLDENREILSIDTIQ